jgi:glycosyltransferase involved in cell wall biosynthesis
MTPLVSVIISTYNSELFIKGKIEDLINQTIFEKLEIIIVNSGSEQNEEEIIFPYAEKYRNIKYIRTENRETIYKAWNRGIRIAKGKYITNSNTDDRLKLDALEILSNALDSDVNAGIVYGDQYIISVPNVNYSSKNKQTVLKHLNYSKILLLSEYLAGPQSMWLSRIHFQDNIWFREEYEVAGDYDFALQVSEKYNLKRISGILGSYYRSNNNTNKELQDINRTLKEVSEIQLKYIRRYVNQLSFNKLKSLLILTQILNYVPAVVLSIFRIVLRKLNARHQIPPPIFWIVIGSVIEENKGSISKALKYCKRYSGKSNCLLTNQFEHLLSL